MCTHHDLLQIFAEEHKTSTCVAPENNLESTQNQSPLYLSWLLHVVLILLLFLLHPYAIAAVGQHKAIKSPTTNTCRWEMMIRSLPLWPQHRRRRSQTQLQQRADGRYIIVPDSAERPIIVPDSADRPIIMPVHADRQSLCRSAYHYADVGACVEKSNGTTRQMGTLVRVKTGKRGTSPLSRPPWVNNLQRKSKKEGAFFGCENN